MRNTLRVLDFLASLQLTIFERPEYFEFFQSVKIVRRGEAAALSRPMDWGNEL